MVCGSPSAFSTVLPSMRVTCPAAGAGSRSLAQTRPGSTASRTACHSPAGGSRGGSRRASCGRPWPGSGARRRRARRRRAVQQRRQPGRAAGRSSASVQPGVGEAERRRVGGAEALEHVEEAGRARRRQALDDAAQRVLLAERHARTGTARNRGGRTAGSTTRPRRAGGSSVGIDCDLADPAPRGLAEPHLVERRLIVAWLSTPGRARAAARRRRWRGAYASGSTASLRRELVDGGVIAAGQHAAPEVRPLAIRSIHATE